MVELNRDKDVANVRGHERTRFQVIVIGGGQAGLCVGRYLVEAGIDVVILEAAARIGESWRTRWDSLRLFTAAEYAGLPGLPFPGDPNAFPSKDEVADYLEDYARRMRVPRTPGYQSRRAPSTRRSICDRGWHHPLRGGTRGHHDGPVPEAASAIVGRESRPGDRSDTLERVQELQPVAGGRRARRRCGKHRRGAGARGGSGGAPRAVERPRRRAGAADTAAGERTSVLVSGDARLHGRHADWEEDTGGPSSRSQQSPGADSVQGDRRGRHSTG